MTTATAPLEADDLRTTPAAHAAGRPSSTPASTPSSTPAMAPRLRLLRHEPDPDSDEHGSAPARAPVAPPGGPVPDLRPTVELRRRAHQVIGLLLEVLAGRRPLTHLAPHLAPPALRYVRAAAGQGPPGSRPSRMTSLHVHRPTATAVEVVAVHRAGPRARALAARFEGPPDAPDRWRCVTLRLL